MIFLIKFFFFAEILTRKNDKQTLDFGFVQEKSVKKGREKHLFLSRMNIRLKKPENKITKYNFKK